MISSKEDYDSDAVALYYANRIHPKSLVSHSLSSPYFSSSSVVVDSAAVGASGAELSPAEVTPHFNSGLLMLQFAVIYASE